MSKANPTYTNTKGVRITEKIKSIDLVKKSSIVKCVAERTLRYISLRIYAPHTTERITLIPTRTTETAIPIIKYGRICSLVTIDDQVVVTALTTADIPAVRASAMIFSFQKIYMRTLLFKNIKNRTNKEINKITN